jgi:hypothetical protein
VSQGEQHRAQVRTSVEAVPPGQHLPIDHCLSLMFAVHQHFPKKSSHCALHTLSTPVRTLRIPQISASILRILKQICQLNYYLNLNAAGKKFYRLTLKNHDNLLTLQRSGLTVPQAKTPDLDHPYLMSSIHFKHHLRTLRIPQISVSILRI